MLTKGTVGTPLALVWGPRIPFPAHGRLFSFFGSGSELVQPCWQLRRAELSFPTQCSGQDSPECRNMALHGTPQCPLPVTRAAPRTLHWAVEGPLSLPSSLSACAVALWPGSEMQRGRCYRGRGIDGFPLITPVQTGGSMSGGSREQKHLWVCGVGCSRPTAVSAIVICFQTSFGSCCRLISQSHERLLTASFPLWGRFVASLFLWLLSGAVFSLSVAYPDEKDQNYSFNNLVLTGSTREFMGLLHP